MYNKKLAKTEVFAGGKVHTKSSNYELIKAEIESRKLWPYVEAKKVLNRHNYDLDYTYTFESGFGPSGFPHIGTFGEVVRTEFIINAIREFGFKTKLIVFSDDMDGLRKIPEGMPAWLKEHLGKPVSSIPDPFGECSSFSKHMNNKLIKMLDWMDIDYEFKSSRAMYETGEFDEGLKILLENYKSLEGIIAPTLSEKTLKTWYPFFPICENCGKVLTTIVKEVNLQNFTVQYSCTKNHGEVPGCGYDGEQSYLGGHGKVTWRVDWPLRWYSLKVDYELYGKDLIESFIVGEKIMNKVFKTEAPENMYYEMFLDETGAKISKSKGKGVTVEDWLKYGNIESLRLLMFKQLQKAKELSFKIIPWYVDNVIITSRDFHSNSNVKEHEFNFITRFKAKDYTYPNISYMLICNLMTTLKTTNKNLIKDYLSKQKDLSRDDLESGFVDEVIEKAGRYYNDFISTETHEVTFSTDDIFYIGQVIGLLYNELTAEMIHNAIYEIAKRNNVEPQKLFKLLYLSLIGQEKGPRLGNFIKMIGQEKTIDILLNRIAVSLKKVNIQEIDQPQKEKQPSDSSVQSLGKEVS
ncbi:MAG: lysine--tRNA ligase [Nitrospirota bacterium]